MVDLTDGVDVNAKKGHRVDYRMDVEQEKERGGGKGGGGIL